jgi:hypothetical protein
VHAWYVDLCVSDASTDPNGMHGPGGAEGNERFERSEGVWLLGIPQAPFVYGIQNGN